MKSSSPYRFLSKDRWALALYYGYFLLLFLQFPLQGSLTGNTDTWWYMGVFNYYENAAIEFFGGEDSGTSLYPEQNAWSFGEPSFGSGAVFLAFKYLTPNVIWAWYFFIALLFALNGFGVYKLSRFYLDNQVARLLAGLFFASVAFAFGHMDDQKVLAFFPALLAFFYFKNFIESEEWKDFLACVLFGGVQVYFSGYVFIFQSLVLGVIGLVHVKKILSKKNLWRPLIFIFPLYLITIIPFLNIYVFGEQFGESINNVDIIQAAPAVSMNFQDFIQPLPNNLIYASEFEEDPKWVFFWHAANAGVVFWILGIVGMLFQSRYRTESFLLVFAGLLIALGPSITMGGQTFKMPMYWLYDAIDLSSLLRIPLRGWFIGLIFMSIFAGAGIQWLLSAFHPRRILLITGILVFFILENIPFPFLSYPSSEYLNPPREYIEYFASKEQTTMLNLPSRILDAQYNGYLSAPGREQLYMYWQTLTQDNSLNGTGYIPQSRWNNQLLIAELDQGKNLDTLIQKNGLQVIVYNKKLILPDEDPGMILLLKRSALLKLKVETPEIAIFEVR